MLHASEAHLKIYDAGVVMGATVTEQVRTFHKRLYKLQAHLDRFFDSLRCAELEIDLTREELAKISEELITHHAKLVDDAAELGLIHFVTAGEHAAYAGGASASPHPGPTICVHTFRLPFERWAGKMRSGAHLVIPSIRHVPPQCYDPKMKYRSRMHFYLADKEAQRTDPDAAALLLDLQGNVTETAAANFLMVKGGTLVSPPATHILPGISRATLIELACRIGIPFSEREIQTIDVLNADEAFLTSTPYCMTPVTKINGVAIGEGQPGPMFRRLIEAWNQQVGLDIQKQIADGAKGTEY